MARRTSLKEKIFKSYVLIGIAIFFCSILILRLFYLQVLRHKSYTEKAEYSTCRIEVIPAPRGNIYDRNGKPIAINKQSITAIIYPNKINNKEDKLKVYNLLSKILLSNPEKLKETILNLPKNAPLPIRLENDISVEEAALIVENQNQLPGVEIQDEPIRYYPHHILASHIIGYIGQIGKEELEDRPERRMGDLVGKDGIEKLFDDILRGKDGKRIVEVDRFGQPINPNPETSLISVDPIPGRDIHLTIDIGLQKTAEKALEDLMASGAIVAVEPNSGEVLALASNPAYDPNVFTKPVKASEWNNLIQRKAFINRAILSYVPGSIWKSVTLAAGLDAMVIKPGDSFFVSGAVYLGSTRFGDWTGATGTYSLEKSLAWSRDTAFYQIGKRLAAKNIYDWGYKFGCGRKTEIELIGESKGILPNEEWKEKNVGEPWYPGNTLHYSIGQSFLLITPVQAARMYSAIANGNHSPKLTLIKKIDNKPVIKKPSEKFDLNPRYLKVIHDGLQQCIESGTGGASRLETVCVAGKTGSAEVPGSSRTHGWFASYAPCDKPEIVAVGFAERAGHGGSVAAPMIKKILERYFKLDEESKKELELLKQKEAADNSLDPTATTSPSPGPSVTVDPVTSLMQSQVLPQNKPQQTQKKKGFLKKIFKRGR